MLPEAAIELPANSTDPSAGQRHLPYLDGLRALAALFVVGHHAILQVDFSRQPLTGPLRTMLRPLFFGHYAVVLFIVLSGFCLMLPVLRGDGRLRGGYLQFLKRRSWRILPPYYFAMGLSLLLVGTLVGQKTGTHWDASLPVSARSIWTHLVMLHDALGEDLSINHVFWSIAVEWRIYLVFPLLLWLWRKLGPLAATLATIVTSYLLFAVFEKTIHASLHAHYLGLFGMGMLAATVVFSESGVLEQVKRWPWLLITLVAGFLLVAVSIVNLQSNTLAPYQYRDAFAGLLSMSLLIAVSCDESFLLTRLLAWRPLVFIGTFAYSIYLIHAPLLQVLWQYPLASLQDKPLMMFLSLATLGTVLIVAASYLFFLACERPFLKLRKRRS